MSQAALLRFLDFLKQELGADDARAELGGRDPDEPQLLWTKLDSGWRLVVIFEAAPADRAAQQAKLDRLAAGFSQTLTPGDLPAPPVTPADTAFRRLDGVLEGLRARAGAVGVAIVDVQSPVVWGSAEAGPQARDRETLTRLGAALDGARGSGLEVEALSTLATSDLAARLRKLRLDAVDADLLDHWLEADDDGALRHYLLTCLALARARKQAGTHPDPRWAHHEPRFGYFVRRMANIYLLVLAFDGAFSELHVESSVLHALPGIEQLLLSLPPLDPPPKGARVLRFPK